MTRPRTRLRPAGGKTVLVLATARRFVLAVAAALLLPALPAMAQSPLLVAPPTLLVPNDDSLPIGTWPAFEANAAVVRTDDSSAVWFNPAGLARAGTSSAAASASTIVRTRIESDGFASDVEGSQLSPSQFAAVLTALREKTGLTLGFGITRLVSWDVRADGLVFHDVPGGRRRVTFSESGSYVRTSYGAAVARDLSPLVRAGLGLSVESVDTVAFVAGTDAVVGTTTRTFTFRQDGENQTLLLRATLGLQADLGGGWGLGAVLRSPGVTLSSTGRFGGDYTFDEPAQTTNVTFFDDEAGGESRLPFEAVLGAAVKAGRLSLEGQVRYFGPGGAHDAFSTDHPATVIWTGAKPEPVVYTVAVPPTRTSRRAIVDLALGGHVDLGTSRKVRLHAGVGTSSAPVPSGDPLFTRADLWSATLGATTRVSSLQLSVGFRYERGSIDDVRSEVLPMGEVVRSGATIRNLGVVFSFAYDAAGGAK